MLIRKGQRYLTVKGPHTGEIVRIVLARTNSVVFKREKAVGTRERHRERLAVFLMHKRLIK